MDKVTIQIIKEINAAISDWECWNDNMRDEAISIGIYESEFFHLYTQICNLIFRFAPKYSVYYLNAKPYLPDGSDHRPTELMDKIYLDPLIGILKDLKTAYGKGFLKTISELISSDLFSDFLEMGDYYLQEGHKDAAAVILGGVLEEHIRKLCLKNHIEISSNNSKGETVSKKTATLNDELAKNNVFNKGYQKQITVWLAIRNDAAHGHYENYSKEQVRNMSEGMRIFINAFPA